MNVYSKRDYFAEKLYAKEKNKGLNNEITIYESFCMFVGIVFEIKIGILFRLEKFVCNAC